MTNQAEFLFSGMEQNNQSDRLISKLRCIAIGSGKGGVGKTMVSVGISCSLAKMKFRTLLFDADLGLANVDLQMGLEPKYTLQDVMYGSCSLADAVIHVPNGPDVLASTSGSAEMVNIGTARQQLLVDELISFAGGYDFLIIDVGAGIGHGVTTFLSASPEVVVVVANEPTSMMDAYSLIKVLSAGGNPPALSFIVNMARSLDEGEMLGQRLNEITRKFLGVEVPLAGIVMYDAIVSDAIRERLPITIFAEKSAVAKCVSDIAKFLAFPEGDRLTQKTTRSFFNRLTEVGLSAREG